MSYQDVDRHNGMIVRKLMSPDKTQTFGYLALPVNYDGKDITKVKKFQTLTEARKAIGHPISPTKSGGFYMDRGGFYMDRP